MTKASMGTVLFALVLLPASAGAVDVFVNGENVTGIQNVSMVNAQVRIDARGNVHIDAPGYTVRRVDVPTQAPPLPPLPSAPPPRGPAGQGQATAGPGVPAQTPLTRRYYLVTSQAGAGRSQFDLEVFVNGQSVGRARNDGVALIDDIGRFLRPGQNQIRVVAHKDVSGGRRSTSTADTHRVIIGEGNEQNGQVTLRVPLMDFSVNAAQAEDQTATFQITAR